MSMDWDQRDLNEGSGGGDSRSLARRIGERLFLLAFGLVFVVVGAVHGVSLLRDLMEADAVQSWNETTCSILASKVREQRDAEAMSLPARR